MRRTTYIWLGFRITLTPLTRRIYKEGSGRLLRRNVSYIAQYFTPFGGGSEQVNKTRNHEVSSDGSVPLTFAEDANYTNTWVQMYELWKTSAHSKCHGVYVIWRYNPGPLRCAGYFRVETSMVGCHVTNRQAVMSGHRRSAVWLIEAIMHMYSCINATKHLKTQK